MSDIIRKFFDVAHIQEEINRGADLCEHVEDETAEPYVAACVTGLCSSRETFVNCRVCEDAETAREDARAVQCGDCGQTIKHADSFTWRWHDFYAEQGDEALILCGPCHGSEKHKQRCRQDRMDRDEEIDHLFAKKPATGWG